MTASLQGRLAQAVLNLINAAKEQGLNAITPVKIKLQGSTSQGDLAAPERYVTISYAKPVIGIETQLWVNPTNRLIFKSDPFAKEWYSIYSFADLFSPYNSVAEDQGGGGAAGGSGTGGGTAIGQPVAATSDLVAMDTAGLPDKTLIYVENERAIYGYDSTSIASGAGVIVPASGVGRWLLVSNASGTVTNLDGGMF
jgi:hypothetical protein